MTELIWDGKYKDGKKVAPVRIPLPFQTIETVNESTEDRKKTLNMFAQGKPTEWRNRLIWGDKKYVLPSLLPEFAGKINLIYIDPPFNVGADFSYTATIPDHPDSEENESNTFLKEPSILEQKAYRDTWGKGLDSYLQWFYETVVVLHDLLAEDGSIYVHLDWHIGHYAKVVLDDIFGYGNFRNEILVKRVKKNVHERELVKSLNVAVDTILFYSKSDETFLRPPMRPENKDERWHSFEAAGFRKGMDYELFGKKPAKDNHWRWTKEKSNKAIKEGKLRANPKTGTPEYFIEASEETLCDSLWDDLQAYTFKFDYPTEKNESLLERIIKASSNEGDLVLDCFCGSGTTAAVAEKLNRRWITCDLGRFSIHTTRKRLLQIKGVKPFVVQNLGKYERQAWAGAEFDNPEDKATQEKAYRSFILQLYHADAINGFNWLHGVKSKRMVHIGAIDSPVALGDVKAIIQEFWKSVGKFKDVKTNGIDILGWEFAFDINETATQQAAANNVDIKFKKIPREALDKRAVEQGDIHFFELAGLDVKAKVKGINAELSLKEFVIPPDDVPEEVRKAVTHWSQWIDYWAVDWNYRDDTFHNEWQSYRKKKEPKIDLTVIHEYEEKGEYTVVVKVIDILGNDTTKALKVVVK
jgi:adenine-specific DNA-methyltransferase